ncbi:hypothetical protein [Glycomyces tenuis]|uniref:hypothetical protein n=1 Tax=Glycomyces tenuis TaxID=58116 RepID=UPI000427B712|nr:hypothetical protein [Glycomyces tenuis]
MAGGPQDGRGQARPQQSPYTSPQSPGRAQPPQSSPPRSQQPAQPYGRQDTPSHGTQSPQRPAPAEEARAPEPFEEAAFADERGGTWGDEGTTAIGKLGYVPKETRRRSDFQKKRSRARKSSPIPKIIAAVVVLGLLGGAGWWWFNRDDSGSETQDAAPGLTYGQSEDPCSLADAAPLEEYIGDVEAETTAEAEQRNSGWEQLCVLTYGAADSSVALLEFEAVSFETDARASVNFELEAGQLAELTDSWTQVDPAPEVGDQAAAVAAVVDEGTSNYHLHVQDDNVYMVVRLALVGSGLDQQGMTDLSVQLADSYLAAWRDAS